jgi:nucleoside-diphosphate-sugar epimerase
LRSAAYGSDSDNDDVARTHIESLDRVKVPGNQRYLVVCPEPRSIRDFAVKFRAEHPELAHRVADLPRLEIGHSAPCKLDVSKGNKAFGGQWNDWYESTSKIIFDVLAWEKKNGAVAHV